MPAKTADGIECEEGMYLYDPNLLGEYYKVGLYDLNKSETTGQICLESTEGQYRGMIHVAYYYALRHNAAKEKRRTLLVRIKETKELLKKLENDLVNLK